MECVVDTGAPIEVARLIQRAAASSAASITQRNVSGLAIISGSMMPLRMVLTTSPPAMMAPIASKTPAMASAPSSVMAPEPTAGPTLLATSLAPIFIAMYAPTIAANTTKPTPAASPSVILA